LLCFGVLHGWHTVLGGIVRFSAYVFIEKHGFILVYFEILALGYTVFWYVLGVDIEEFGFGAEFLYSFEFVFQWELCLRVVHLGDDSSVNLLAGVAFLVFGVLAVEEHAVQPIIVYIFLYSFLFTAASDN
jgi:hypothetical protein